MKIQDMEYTLEFNPPEMLAFGYHRNRRYYVISYGHHPCCYIEVLKRDRWYREDYMSEDIDITVHGGLSFSSSSVPSTTNNGWFFGWDYAHYGDYTKGVEEVESNYSTNLSYYSLKMKKWTTEELENECITTIDQLAYCPYL